MQQKYQEAIHFRKSKCDMRLGRPSFLSFFLLNLWCNNTMRTLCHNTAYYCDIATAMTLKTYDSLELMIYIHLMMFHVSRLTMCTDIC